MYESPVSILSMVFIIVLSVSVLLFGFLSSESSKTRVVFCDVGQGDSAYIRTENGTDILIDGGYSRQVLNCLGKYMPFYDRTIEMLIATHPEQDHFGGFTHILDRYKVQTLMLSPISSDGQEYKALITKAKDKGVTIRSLYSTDVIHINKKVKMEFLWPDYQFVSENASIDDSGLIFPQSDPNDFSLVAIFSEEDVDILFTGDITPDISNILASNTILQKKEIEILKVPHHGSKNGMTPKLLNEVKPILSVISAGRNNRFKHPSPEILDLFEAENLLYKNTADVGNIVLEIKNGVWDITSGFYE